MGHPLRKDYPLARPPAARRRSARSTTSSAGPGPRRATSDPPPGQGAYGETRAPGPDHKGQDGLVTEATPGERARAGRSRLPLGENELDAPLPTKRMTVNLGPSHPAMHGVTRAVVELEGEIIRSMKLDIGFLHRGFQKSCENVTWTQCFPYTDRLNYVSSIMNNVGLPHRGREARASSTIPSAPSTSASSPPSSTASATTSRCVGAIGLELGAFDRVPLRHRGARAASTDRVAELSGARLTIELRPHRRRRRATCPRAGSRRRSRRSTGHRGLPSRIDELAHPQPHLHRPHAAAPASSPREDAIDFGFTGPCLRASGVAYDVRKATPYCVYDRLDFDVPRRHERRQLRPLPRCAWRRCASRDRIIRQCFAQMPSRARSSCDDWRIRRCRPSRWCTARSRASWPTSSWSWRAIQVPAGEVYSYTEAANGELGWYVVSRRRRAPVQGAACARRAGRCWRRCRHDR